MDNHDISGSVVGLPMESSPFQHILYTNAVPSDQQYNEIRVFLAPHRAKHAKLEEEVALLRKMLESALQARSKLESFIAPHAALLSPMRRMPDDLLRLIFLHTLPEERNAAVHGSEGPLLIANICSHWRGLAMTTPRLWSKMHLVVPTLTPGSPQDAVIQTPVVAQLTQWLKRGGAVPIDISTHAYQMLSEDYQSLAEARAASLMRSSHRPVVSPYLSTLLSVTSRWRNMKLLAFAPLEVDALLQLKANDVPQLEKFEIITNSPIPNKFEILSTPSLRALNIRSTIATLPSTIGWEALVELDLYILPAADVGTDPFPFPFLARCTSLQRLELSLGSHIIDQSDTQGGHGPALPKLTALILKTTYAHNIETTPRIFLAIRRLQLPNLRTLDLCSNIGMDFETTFGLLKAVGHSIQSLALSMRRLSSGQVTSCLQLVPLVERLRLVSDPSDKIDVLTSLNPHPTSNPESEAVNPICPALSHLEFNFTSVVPDDAIVHFLNARASALPPLRCPATLIQRVLSPGQATRCSQCCSRCRFLWIEAFHRICATTRVPE
ncbi:F-box domain-containing protein [Mycena indigotica]|uniref:F-box domain-containing protein n=1 Tax=Mycena indigotica TaxID=2126181 RepID=A0A8H6W1U3_9AGAR|nr:F-box domain-containing protein [Mycena indigotica]KAF7298563.1 F-box domain-containing protein [Mycena indigotica]